MEFKQKYKECRICLSQEIEQIHQFPNMPIVAEPVQVGVEVETSNLTVLRCRSCNYFFLGEVIDPIMYKDYKYSPQWSLDVIDYLIDFSKRVINLCNLNPKSIGLEIGSGDGSLSKIFSDFGIKFIGVEPSSNLAKVSSTKNEVETINNFFNFDLAKGLKKRFEIIVARHVLEHIDDFRDFFKSIDLLLSKDGNVVIEVPYLGDILNQKQFYAFFFEHLSYFSVSSIAFLFNKYGFNVYHVDHVYPEGGSIVLYASRKDSTIPQEKIDLSIFKSGFLSNSFLEFKRKFKELLSNGKISIYGAGQRSITLLNLIGVSSKEIIAIYDENPAYDGLVTPFSKIPIMHPRLIDKTSKEPILILATSYDSQIRKKYSDINNRFISLHDLIC